MKHASCMMTAAMNTAGHAKKYDSLISGDAILGSRRKNRLVLPAIYSNRRQMRKTVRRLNALNPARVYPAHGTSFDGEWLLHHWGDALHQDS